MIEKYMLSAVTTGTTGSATGSNASSNVISGHVMAVYFACASGGTATVTLSQQSAGENIINLTQATSSAWYYPRRALSTNAGSVDLTYNGTSVVYGYYCVCDYLSMGITNATTSATFSLNVYVEN